MSLEDTQYFTITVKFPKMSKPQENSLYLEKFKSWILAEKSPIAFDRTTSAKRSFSMQSKVFLFSLFLEKELKLVLATRKPKENIDQLNAFSNWIFSFLNTTLPEGKKEAIATTEFGVSGKAKTNFPRKVIGESRMAKICEITKSSWKPFAIAGEWKTESRLFFTMVGTIDSTRMVNMNSTLEWKDGLPLDSLLMEKKELLKFEEAMDKVETEESLT